MSDASWNQNKGGAELPGTDAEWERKKKKKVKMADDMPVDENKTALGSKR